LQGSDGYPKKSLLGYCIDGGENSSLKAASIEIYGVQETNLQ